MHVVTLESCIRGAMLAGSQCGRLLAGFLLTKVSQEMAAPGNRPALHSFS
jgi:hypothetical protein